MKRLVLLVTVGLLLNGCGPKKVALEPASFVERKLLAASEAISYDLALLTGSEQRQVGGAKATGGLAERMDFNYDGPIADALMRVCAKAGYKFIVEGTIPNNPPLISLRLKDRTCLDILRAIGQQTGANEGVIVQEEKASVTLVYKPG